MTDLSGLVVVVTGATGALGPDVVGRAAAAGAQVVVVGRDAAAMDTLVAAGNKAVSASSVDLSNEQE
ncbi:MAG: alcohol dehydrogenase, partial [Allobranchiibius sp.]